MLKLLGWEKKNGQLPIVEKKSGLRLTMEKKNKLRLSVLLPLLPQEVKKMGLLLIMSREKIGGAGGCYRFLMFCFLSSFVTILYFFATVLYFFLFIIRSFVPNSFDLSPRFIVRSS